MNMYPLNLFVVIQHTILKLVAYVKHKILPVLILEQWIFPHDLHVVFEWISCDQFYYIVLFLNTTATVPASHKPVHRPNLKSSRQSRK